MPSSGESSSKHHRIEAFLKIQVCGPFILLLKLFLCCMSFNFMQINIQARGVNHYTNVARGRSYCVMKSLMLCIK